MCSRVRTICFHSRTRSLRLSVDRWLIHKLSPKFRSSLMQLQRFLGNVGGGQLIRTAALPTTLLVVCLLPQALFTWNVGDRLLYEELAESVRNPYWLSQRLSYDGISCNIGWYGTLAVVYKVCGFSLHVARSFRFFLHATALVALYFILRRSLSLPRTILPLVSVSLSPTALYLNTSQASFGIDLALAPLIFLWILRTSTSSLKLLQGALHGAVLTLAALCYPSCIAYLPALFVFLLYRANLRSVAPRQLGAYLSMIALGGASVCAFFLLYLKNPLTFLDDPVTGAGILRCGGGMPGLDYRTMTGNAASTLHEFFSGGTSHYFGLPRPDLVWPLGPVLLILLLVLALVLMYGMPHLRAPIGCALLLLGSGLFIPSIAPYVPGARRATGMIAGFYALIFVAWVYAAELRSPSARRAAFAAMLILLLHLVSTIPANVQHLSQERNRVEDPWLATGANSNTALQHLLRLSHYTVLDCGAVTGLRTCRFSEIYGALAGAQWWNDLPPHPIRAVHPSTGEVIELSPQLWVNYTLPH
jgi:hypothetical protein